MINEKKVHFSAFFCLQTILDSVVYTYQMNGECYERVQCISASRYKLP